MNTSAPSKEDMMSWQESVTGIHSIGSRKFKGGPCPKPRSCRRNEAEIIIIVANVIHMTHFMYAEWQIAFHLLLKLMPPLLPTCLD